MRCVGRKSVPLNHIKKEDFEVSNGVPRGRGDVSYGQITSYYCVVGKVMHDIEDEEEHGPTIYYCCQQ